jgi:hypothetical protein
LTGKVEKNDMVIPHGPLIPPVAREKLPELDEDRSIR